MKPIDKKLLVNTVTVFNAWKDPETGETRAARTVLRNTRLMTAVTRYAGDRYGGSIRHSLEVLVDRRNTVAMGGPEGDLVKTHMAPADWDALADKEGHWTLREADWILAEPGRLECLAPEYDGGGEEAFVERHRLRRIGEVYPVIDKDGSIHHWRVSID